MATQQRFRGGPWNGRQRDVPGEHVPNAIVVPDTGYSYRLAEVVQSDRGDIIAMYEPDPEDG